MIDYRNEFSKLEYYCDLLSENERKKSNSFFISELRNKFIITRAILKKIISEYTHENPKKIAFKYNKFNKPYLKNDELFFNISHSNDLLLIALSDTEIGVDIEYKDASKATDDLAKEFFSKTEYVFFEKMDLISKVDFFYNIWSIKESLIKLFGEGFLFSPNLIDLYHKIDDFNFNTIKLRIREVDIYTKKILIDKNYSSFLSSYNNKDYEILQYGLM